MEERLLVAIAVIISLLGLFAIFSVSAFLDDGVVVERAGDVKIAGFVSEIKTFDNRVTMEIAELKTVNVVFFDKNLVSKKKIGKSDNVTIYGQPGNYNGQAEIIAYDIRKS